MGAYIKLNLNPGDDILVFILRMEFTPCGDCAQCTRHNVDIIPCWFFDFFIHLTHL